MEKYIKRLSTTELDDIIERGYGKKNELEPTPSEMYNIVKELNRRNQSINNYLEANRLGLTYNTVTNDVLVKEGILVKDTTDDLIYILIGNNPADSSNWALINTIASDTPVYTVNARTTGALPNSPVYNNGTGGVGATLTAGSNTALAAQDGVTLIVDDKLMVANQADETQNGVYSVTVVGSGSTPWVLTRVSFMDSTAEAYPIIVNIAEGSVNANKFFRQSTENPVIGTDDIIWEEIASTDVPNASSFISGKTIYVDRLSPYATDTRAGLSNYDGNNPFKTIQAAVLSATNGDLIKIAAGTYTENITVTNKNIELFLEGQTTIINSGASNTITYTNSATGSGNYFIIRGQGARGSKILNNNSGTSALSVTQSSNGFIFIAQNCYIYKTGATSTASTVNITPPLTSTGYFEFENCLLSISATSGSTPVVLLSDGASGVTGSNLIFNRCSVFNEAGGSGSNKGISAYCNTLQIYNDSIITAYSNPAFEMPTGTGIKTLNIRNSLLTTGAACTVTTSNTSSASIVTNIHNAVFNGGAFTGVLLDLVNSSTGSPSGKITHSTFSQTTAGGKSLQANNSGTGSLSVAKSVFRGTIDATTDIDNSVSVVI